MKKLLYGLGIAMLCSSVSVMAKTDTKSEHYKDVKDIKEVKDVHHAIVFVGTEWCPHCKHAEPQVKKIAEQHKVNVLHVNPDKVAKAREELLQPNNIQGFPTFLIIKDGKVVEKIVGANIPALEKAIIDIEKPITKKEEKTEHKEKAQEKTVHTAVAYKEVTNIDDAKPENVKNGLVYVGTEWCKFCKEAEKIVARLAKEYPNAPVLYVNPDKVPNTRPAYLKQHGIEGFPTFLVVINGKVANKVMGADSYGLEKAFKDIEKTSRGTEKKAETKKHKNK